MQHTGTIGIFDSGLGGLWVLKHLENHLPNYNYIYYADQAHIPYGSKEPEEITKLSFGIVDFLITKGCTLVVVACNTATSAAITSLREKYPHIIFVGMEPAIKPASINSKTGHVGVLATKVTAQGRKLQESIEKFANTTEVHTCIGYGLVELVEQGKGDSDEVEVLLRTYLEPLLKYNIDQLVLGCTHYAFLINRIKKIVGEKVIIVDPAYAVVARVFQLLEVNSINPPLLQNDPEFFTSGSNVEALSTFFTNIQI